MTFTILTVCTGNICRSPLAAFLLTARLRYCSDIQVVSAGTRGLTGAPMDPEAAIAAKSVGINDVSDHFASKLDTSTVQRADLILGLARQHRSAIAELSPRSLRKTFTLREFARIGNRIPRNEIDELRLAHELTVNDHLEAAVELVALNRGMYPVRSPEDDDVVDPYLKSPRVHKAVATEIAEACDAVAAFVRSFVPMQER